MRGVPDLILILYDLMTALIVDTWEVIVLVVILTTLAQFLYGCWGRQLVALWRQFRKRHLTWGKSVAGGGGGGQGEGCCDEGVCENECVRRKSRARCGQRRSSTSCASYSSSSCGSSCSCCGSSCGCCS